MNRICKLFEIQYPIIQGGMIWCSGWEMVSAVSNAGGLGLIGAGSMDPDLLRLHIQKTKKATNMPFGVNLPLIYQYVEDHMKVIIEEKIKIVFTSAGNPKTWTKLLQKNGIKVAHVVSGSKFALKADEAGVDAIVAEGFEAGGHNGREETTSMVLIPAVRAKTEKPLIAAGGIGNGRAMLATMMMGANGVQIGSRFAASIESSAHSEFKKMIVEAGEGSTKLLLKKLIPVRLLQNTFSHQVEELENIGASSDTLLEFLGKGRARIGMYEGNTEEGEFEIGQVSTLINQIQSIQSIFDEIIMEYKTAIQEINMKSNNFEI
jgi:enoyl-[acyl-carrier protein] reductase II